MTEQVLDRTFTCNRCGSSGSLRWMDKHPCDHNAYVKESGGRCEDYPCCGHTDGDGCAALESHTSEFYAENPHLLHEPGSPEWYDAMDDRVGWDPDEIDPDECEHGDKSRRRATGRWECDLCATGGVEIAIMGQRVIVWDNGDREVDGEVTKASS